MAGEQDNRLAEEILVPAKDPEQEKKDDQPNGEAKVNGDVGKGKGKDAEKEEPEIVRPSLCVDDVIGAVQEGRLMTV